MLAGSPYRSKSPPQTIRINHAQSDPYTTRMLYRQTRIHFFKSVWFKQQEECTQ